MLLSEFTVFLYPIIMCHFSSPALSLSFFFMGITQYHPALSMESRSRVLLKPG